MIAFDTNVLVAMHRADDARHDDLLAALDDVQDQRWAVPWPCIHEFLAVVTRAPLWREVTPIGQAFDAIEHLLTRPGTEPIGERRGHLDRLRQQCEPLPALGGAVHDARIAAICLAHDVETLWTADRDFARFPGLVTHNPLEPS